MSATGRYRHLFQPLRLGPVTVANRIVFSAHLTNYAAGGLPTEQHAAYYAARAAGGAGLIITEEHSTHPTDWPYEKLIHGFHPEVVPGYRRITDAVHAHGVPIFAQLNHNGGQGSGMYSRLPVWAPSPIPDPLFREVPKAVDHAEIDEIVAGYATVARHCRDGGFDGVELQCSHSSIVRGFLSPATNARTDEYGGALPNRARLLLRLVAAVRAAIGPDLALGVRLCGDELIDGGTTIDEAVAVARLVEATRAVDYVNTSIGVATATLHMIEASMSVPPGYALFIPSALRKAVELPVVGVGRFKDPVQADRALADGHADLIGVVRGQIADADFAAKARSGHAADIRTCLSCNQECVGRMGLNRWLGCIENPRTGKESVPLPSPRAAKRVVVVGGGPGGLQAAATAAQRGHRVTLLERRSTTGGQVAVAASVPQRAEFLDVVRNSLAECRRYGVEVRTGEHATAESLRALRPDVVVLATGARPQRPHWAGDLARVVDVRDVLEGRAAPSGQVLVVDELGFHQATSVAELLADRGCAVRISTPGMVVGQDLGITLDLESFAVRAAAKRIEQTTDEVVLDASAADDGRVRVQLLKHTTGASGAEVFDWVVCATHQEPEEELWLELSASGELPVHRVGDCVAPRRAHAAVLEGHRAAVAL
ncbi:MULTISPECIES: mycofactocin system FadH/OYE family oxidoreductase 2 [unclassified Saccharopolyspora]|uniref:mycofactocin system FadH/OYE family oxidoreductase 2 n=1 Tax=unclassified Saccharopolyspora TaxID=2646250 RepID=UPI001CD41AFF|nr:MULTISPECIES: mycofactocin system FadH/OYE family oxidoreductase 2 [unclassified Saccharopolyspora]MCA1185374.1 mycofactocin system FadH/OYE family oxidoreductase 2 [Saccharopolyspora sp. 6T]MCA1279361.1 mycofactocin system FadH/OYE family oxidoreductase 2 [Saccharopolyspora sp. 7B]